MKNNAGHLNNPQAGKTGVRRGHESVNHENTPQFLVVGNGGRTRRIAYLRRAPKPGTARPGIIWLGGFRSDMLSIKATHLDCYARESGCAYVRFDYSGHGLSEGRFEAGTIGAWLEESLTAVRLLTDGPQILAGSSMGGWLALLVARALHESGEVERLKGLVLIAPAVDFTESLIFARMPAAARAELTKTGVWLRASAYAPEPYPITWELIEEGRKHLLLGGVIRTHCPVHILQGMQDEDVPWRHATELAEHLPADPVSLTLVKDGDHRLSRPEDLTRLSAAVESIGS